MGEHWPGYFSYCSRHQLQADIDGHILFTNLCASCLQFM